MPKVMTTSFLESRRPPCFTKRRKFRTFKESFAIINSLSEIGCSNIRSIMFVKMRSSDENRKIFPIDGC